MPVLAAALAATMGAGACQRFSLTAPSGATIDLAANATSVPLGGTVTITAIALEQGGIPVNNGTVITFTTDLGTIDPAQARTHNGRVDVTFSAGNRSGTANINAVSGSAKASALTIAVGAAAANTISLTVTPAIFGSSGGTATAVATVLDKSGNPLPNIPVTFTSTAGTVAQPTVNTDSSGQATTTIAVRNSGTVSASAGSATVSTPPAISLNVPPTASVSVTPPTATLTDPAGVPVTVTISSVDTGCPGGGTGSCATDRVVSWSVDFGDGSSQSGSGTPPSSLTHNYTSLGTFQIELRLTDSFGETGVATAQVTIGGVAAKADFTISPSSPCTGTVTQFNGSTSTGTQPLSFSWNFGDPTSGSNTASGMTVTHSFATAGTYTVTLTVTDAVGHISTTTKTVTIGAAGCT